MEAPPARQSATYDADRFSIGIEGYYDQYEEDSVSLTDKGMFGGVSLAYTHYFNPQWFAGIDARGAIGSTDYESVSGTIDDIPQWEVETRLLTGYDIAFPGRGVLKPYFGFGTRYFVDELKGKVTETGANGYDRRIFQIFMPIGATYEYSSMGLDFAPNLEIAPLIWGNVSSRLGTLAGFYNVENRQDSGMLLKGEFMMGQRLANGTSWQFGPFVRYWDVPDSKTEVDPASRVWIEPENTRLQAGASVKYSF
jgi:hypothetical protein